MHWTFPRVQGEEVGYFSYGGSATVTLFKPGCIKWDEDLAENSRHLWETKVKYGQSLGVMRALGRPQARTEPWHVDSHEEWGTSCMGTVQWQLSLHLCMLSVRLSTAVPVHVGYSQTVKDSWLSEEMWFHGGVQLWWRSITSAPWMPLKSALDEVFMMLELGMMGSSVQVQMRDRCSVHRSSSLSWL